MPVCNFCFALHYSYLTIHRVLQKKAPTVKEYLDDIDVSKLTSGLWDPAKQWNRWHGDGKSTTGGTYHIESIHASDGEYKAKVVGPGGKAVREVSYPSNTTPAPTFATVLHDLKAA